uniref:Uncharacterized protein n=1 Tax=Eutreptiella gymnastica TaxID=73025 RepID=A0A6T2BT87_9EUGL
MVVYIWLPCALKHEWVSLLSMTCWSPSSPGHGLAQPLPVYAKSMCAQMWISFIRDRGQMAVKSGQAVSGFPWPQGSPWGGGGHFGSWHTPANPHTHPHQNNFPRGK